MPDSPTWNDTTHDLLRKMVNNQVERLEDVSPTHEGLTVTGNATINGTLTVGKIALSDTVWDDIRIVPSAFDFAGITDPTNVPYQPAGSGATFRLWEFALNDEAFAMIQMPHGYKRASDLRLHVHWNPREYGVAQRGRTVGWKVDYSMARVYGVFPASQTAILTSTVPADCQNHQHLMSTSTSISVPADFGESGMILIRLYRTDTGADDTWSETLSGRLPLLLEFDIHYEMDKLGSDDELPIS